LDEAFRLTRLQACVMHSGVNAVADAVGKMQSLSPERAARVVSLINAQ